MRAPLPPMWMNRKVDAMDYLICDDSEHLRKVIRLILERQGHSVVGEASNADDAVALYKEHRAIMLLDIVMPGTNGLDALREIMSFDPEAKVILVTALAHETVVKQGLAIGAAAFIPKPFSPNELLQGLSGV